MKRRCLWHRELLCKFSIFCFFYNFKITAREIKGLPLGTSPQHQNKRSCCDLFTFRNNVEEITCCCLLCISKTFLKKFSWTEFSRFLQNSKTFQIWIPLVLPTRNIGTIEGGKGVPKLGYLKIRQKREPILVKYQQIYIFFKKS